MATLVGAAALLYGMALLNICVAWNLLVGGDAFLVGGIGSLLKVAR